MTTLLRFCECCRSIRAVIRRTADPRGAALMGGKVQADLCKDCADGGHELALCLFCPEAVRVWRCAQLDHVAHAHPGIIERRAREPEDLPPQPDPHQRTLGRIQLDVLGEQQLPRRTIF